MIRSLIQTLRRHSFQAHSLTLAMMVAASALAYPAARSGADFWIWVALGLFILANLIELVIK